MKKFAWYSDTHLNLSILPFLKRLFLRRLNNSGASGVFITGDVSSGRWIESDLKFLARHFSGPIYFVLGNHDYHGRHIESVHADVRRLSKKYSNLRWLTEEPIISLAEDVALIGNEGWYDTSLGNSDLLRYTTDWLVTFDFLHLNNHEERLEMWSNMAKKSAELISEKLITALDTNKTVYILTHFPPWKEATKTAGTRLEKLWLSYNTNAIMGATIEKIMNERKDKRVVVLSGHTHMPCHIRVSNSIECIVSRASYLGRVTPEETIII